MFLLNQTQINQISGAHVVVDLSGVNINVTLTNESDALFLMMNNNKDVYYFSNAKINNNRMCSINHNVSGNFYTDPEFNLLIGDVCQFNL